MKGTRWLSLLLLCGATGCYAQQNVEPDAQKNPFAGKPAATAEGRHLYDQTCQACHGGNAEGGRGPALANGNFTHGSSDTDLFRTIRTGIPGTQMPAFSNMPADNVWKIITYLRSLNTSGAEENEVVPGDRAAGEAVYWRKGHCGDCHQVNERGVEVGVDLSEAGQKSASALRAAIVNPNAPVSFMERFRRPEGIHVTLRDGKTFTGIKKAEDNFTLLMTDLHGDLQRFSRDQIQSETEAAKSLMPDNYAQLLTPAELQNLIAYLKNLKVRDLSKTIEAQLPPGLTFDRLRDAQAEPQNWLTYWGSYGGDHYSALRQINGSNVRQLQARWAVPMPPGPQLEATPLVVDGTLYTTYTTNTAGGVKALDAQSGLPIWAYERRQKVTNPYGSNPFNRGVAVLGDRVFFGTLDAALVSLDARTGRVLWETQVANTMEGYSITEAPLAIKDQIIVGVAGGEFGIRGFVDAYDAVTGKRLWRFYTVPGPAEFGNDSWSGDSWKRGSGATWMTGSYDPDLNLLYWAVGNPGPDLDGDVRKGDNLFTCSVVALDPTSGKLRWYYQFTPADTHDWDSNEDLVLTDRVIDGVKRKLMLHADRNGFFYVLDRVTGKLIFAKPYVKQTWNGGFHPDGKPIFLPGWKATPEGTTVSPSFIGGADWANPSYDPLSETLYVVATEGGLLGYRSAPERFESGKQYLGGRPFVPEHQAFGSGMMAIESRNGVTAWSYPTLRPSMAAGTLATRGGLVFLATADGNLIALDSSSRKPLWHFQTGGTIASSPMSYAVNGKQYVAISAGNTLYSFALPQ